MSEVGSVTQLMHEGTDEAYWALYVRFVTNNDRLLKQIGHRLPSDRVAEPIDVVGDAFEKLWKKAQEGGHRDFANRNNLQALLTCYAKGRADDVRKAKRPLGESSVLGDSAGPDLGAVDQRRTTPTEDELKSAKEGIEHWLEMLDGDEQRRIALEALDGKTQEEIAQTLGTNVKRIERALKAIRSRWTEDLVSAFRQSWKSGKQPGFEGYFYQFLTAGKWLLKDLVEIEIHERLRLHLPVSLGDFLSRVGQSEYVTEVNKAFRNNLFFDDTPDTETVLLLESMLEPELYEVIKLKLAGHTNQEIADQWKWPISSIKDTLKHARQVLSEMTQADQHR